MRIRLLFFILISAAFLYAQDDETLLGSGEVENGGYGGPVIKFTQLNGEFGIMAGGRGGWIINHTFVIGGAGYGVVNKINTSQTFEGEVIKLEVGYGGLMLEYIVNSDKLIHYNFSLLIGGGGVNYRLNNYRQDWEPGNIRGFFVMEPEVNAVLNITKFLRLSANVSYRFITGVQLDDIGSSDLSGPSAGIAFLFGSF